MLICTGKSCRIGLYLVYRVVIEFNYIRNITHIARNDSTAFLLT